MSVPFQFEARRAASIATRPRFGLLRAALCALFCFAVAHGSSAAGEERVLLSAVRIEIDGRMSVWNADGIFSLANGSGRDAFAGAEQGPGGDEAPPRLKPETVASFFSLRPGRLYKADDLESRCREAEIRLLDSGLFYAAQAVVLPPKKGSGECTVLVSASSGFFWRFGGGSAFGSFGRAALAGERLSVRGYAGWNRTGAEILHERFAGLPIIAGASVFLHAPGEWSGMIAATGLSVSGPSAEAYATLGVSPAPDYRIGADSAVVQSGFDGSGRRVYSFQPFFRYRRPGLSGASGKEGLPGASDSPDRRDRSTTSFLSGCDARLFYFPQDGSAKAEGSFSIKWNATERCSLNTQSGGGISKGSFGFDLYSAEDRSVRSGYTRDELSFSSFLMTSTELRFAAASVPFGLGFDCRIEPYVFLDAAFSGDDVRDSRYAAGPALRLLFDSPVFAYFSASWGINPEGQGRFILWGTAGF